VCLVCKLQVATADGISCDFGFKNVPFCKLMRALLYCRFWEIKEECGAVNLPPFINTPHRNRHLNRLGISEDAYQLKMYFP